MYVACYATGDVPEATSGTPLPYKICSPGLPLPLLQAGGPGGVAISSQEQASGFC